MRKLTLLAVMLGMTLMMLVVAAPAMAQDAKAQKDQAKAQKAQAKAQKDQAKMQKTPLTGGVPIDASLLGLGAGALLVSSGLLVHRVLR
jgi:hypothetical protein